MYVTKGPYYVFTSLFALISLAATIFGFPMFHHLPGWAVRPVAATAFLVAGGWLVRGPFAYMELNGDTVAVRYFRTRTFKVSAITEIDGSYGARLGSSWAILRLVDGRKIWLEHDTFYLADIRAFLDAIARVRPGIPLTKSGRSYLTATARWEQASGNLAPRRPPAP